MGDDDLIGGLEGSRCRYWTARIHISLMVIHFLLNILVSSQIIICVFTSLDYCDDIDFNLNIERQSGNFHRRAWGLLGKVVVVYCVEFGENREVVDVYLFNSHKTSVHMVQGIRRSCHAQGTSVIIDFRQGSDQTYSITYCHLDDLL